MTLNDLQNLFLFESGIVRLTMFTMIKVIVVLLIARILNRTFTRIFNKAIKSNRINRSSAFALKKIAQYFVWVIALLYIMDVIGAPITVLLASSTALFVGLGLGMQETFKDFVSGIILLTERTVTVGDIIESDGLVGKVSEISLRTTKVWTRDQISVIIPNSKLTNQGFINWTHQKTSTRFNVDVGVKYGSDTREVERLLSDCMNQHKLVSKNPKPSVQFRDFGDSSLVFRCHFYSTELFKIEFIKSDLRHAINEAFNKADITIAFPQLDVWIKQTGEQ